MLFRKEGYKMKNVLWLIFCILVTYPLSVFSGSSIFGLRSQALGEYQYPFSTASMGRGGINIAFVDSISVNHFNFALWNNLTRSTISLNLGYQNIYSETQTDNIRSSTANFQGGFLVLPLQSNKLTLGFGLIPYSQNNIRLETTQSGQGTAPIQTVSVSGTISQAQFALAYKIIPTLSIGLSGNYTFGLITDQFDIDYSEAGFGDIFIENRYQIYGAGFGIHSFYDISSRLAAGLTVKFPATLTLFTEQISINTKKTIEENRKMTIPLHLGTGISYLLTPRWRTGADFHYHTWKEGYKIGSDPVNNMSNSFRFAIGAEREPITRRFTSYAENITWRFGFFIGQLNTMANGKSVDEIGFGLGIGLPIIKNRNRFDIAFELGKRGSLDVNRRSEIYFRLNFELSTNELWFIREER